MRHAGRMVVLVPRQLRFTGMTGDVPYYGGRFTPAQAYAASHPSGTRPPPPAVPPDQAAPRPDPVAALAQLRDQGVITQEEYERFRTRITS